MPTRRHAGLDAAAERLGSPSLWGRLLLRAVLLTALVGGAALLLAASLTPPASLASTALGAIDEQLFRFPPLPDDLAEPSVRSVVLARDGSTLAVLRAENRVAVALDEVPEHVQGAVLATEDAEFRRHGGVSWRAVARAALGNVRAGRVTGGGSTITQQLVKNVVLGSEQSMQRKLQEAVYAVELERRMSKDEILEAYLNEAYFGNGVYGLGTAAEFYWGKAVGELTVAEGALLAGIIRAPQRNDPLRHPRAALQRRAVVLEQMATHGVLTPGDAARAVDAPLGLRPAAPESPREPFFVAYVRELLKRDPALGPDAAVRDRTVLRGGLEIRTTLDPRLQRAAQEAIGDVLAGPDGPQAALPVVDPHRGEILAVGLGPKRFGTGPGQTEVNPAVPGVGASFGRQPGSAFKPFGVVAALEHGLLPTYTIDTPSPYVPVDACDDPSDSPWRPGNYSDGGGGVMDMAEATAWSSNVYFAHLVDRHTGPERLVDVARRMGVVHSALAPHCAAVLGSEEVFPLDMAAAFGTLAADGLHCRTYAIAEVRDRHGRVISRQDPDCRRAISPAVSARATDLLRAPVERGTASRHARIGRPAAGKTGTTGEHRDAWFVGFIPQLSAAVWVGHERPQPMTDPRCDGGVTGGCLPAMIWQRFMSRAVAALELAVEEFPPPPPLPTGAVPDVTWRERSQAEATLTGAGFRPAADDVVDHRPAGTVVAQEPVGGAMLEAGSQVRLSVSDGTGSPPSVPDVVGLDRDAAEPLLAAHGLTAHVVEVTVLDGERIGVVVGQRPAAGTPLDELAGVLPDGAAGEVVLDVGRESEDAEPTPSPSPTDGPSPSPTAGPSPSPTGQPSPSPVEPAPPPTADPPSDRPAFQPLPLPTLLDPSPDPAPGGAAEEPGR